MTLTQRKGEFIMATLRLLFGLLLGALLVGGTAMAQLSGTYTIGDDPEDNYASFTAAASDLTTLGVGGPVTFNVEQLTYSESVTIGQITGASATNTITFRDAGTLDTPPLISANVTPAVNLDGADYITFDGIDITLTVTGKVVQITGDADYNVIKNCLLTGALQTGTSNYGVHITAGCNDYNVIENVTVNRSVNRAVYLNAAPGATDQGNEVRNCTLIGGKYGVYLTYQNGAVVRGCDIQPGYDGLTSESAGICCGGSTAGELSPVVAYGNEIHNIRGGGTTGSGRYGIYVIGGELATGRLFKAYNNFVYDFVVTGSSPCFGLCVMACGTVEVYFNSVRIGDVGTSGPAYGFYGWGLGTPVYLLKNNIFQIEEPTTACWAIYRSQGQLTSDYNCVYGTGTGYSMGRDSLTDYATLALWQAAMSLDLNSVEGNPGFMGPTDLHIQPHYSLLNGMGVDTAGIASDIDGNLRGSPPDIGADEYMFTPMAHDYGVNKWVGWQYYYIALTPVVVRAEVKNYGTSNETDVPVRLFYNGVQQDSVLLSLTSGQMDTVELDWTPPLPAGEMELGVLEVQAFCPSDTFAQNDSIRATVRVERAPLSGVYDLGGGANDYATFTAAATSLNLRSVSGAVTFNVYPLTYSESITIGQIRGASATNTITFRDAGTLDTPPEIVSGTSPAVYLNGADYVTFDGIDITLTVTGMVVRISGNADYNTIKNCTLTGTSQTSTSNYGVRIYGGGNDHNVIENVTVNRTVGRPVYLAGVAATRTVGNEVRNCTLIGGASGVTVSMQESVSVHDCDIQPGWDGATGEISGISVYGWTPGEPSVAYANKIHNIRGAGITNGIYAAPYTSDLFKAYNNFVYDFVVTGTAPLYGMRVVSGTSEFYFNSVRIGDVGTTGNANGFYQEVDTSTAVLKNNIFQIEEPTTACWAINRSAGTLTSDYNCVYGTGTGYNMGGDGGTNYATLALWQAATSRDLNSVEGNPGFMGPTDLHIDSLATLVDSAGTAIDGITDDIDGDVRGTPPDIGADEYDAAPEAVDNLTIFPDADSSNVVLRWTPSARAIRYYIYRGNEYGFVIDGITYIGQTAGTTYTDVGILSEAGARFYVVLASR
jgi:hypothetical protein